jgi:hypothetical protein
MKVVEEDRVQLYSLMSEEVEPLKGDIHFTTPTISKGIDEELKGCDLGNFEHW